MPEGDVTGAEIVPPDCATSTESVAVSLPSDAPSPRATNSVASRQDSAAGARGTAGTTAGEATPDVSRIGAIFAT